MKTVIRFQSQLPIRRSYKAHRVLRIRPGNRLNLTFRPSNRFGQKPQLEIVPQDGDGTRGG